MKLIDPENNKEYEFDEPMVIENSNLKPEGSRVGYLKPIEKEWPQEGSDENY